MPSKYLFILTSLLIFRGSDSEPVGQPHCVAGSEINCGANALIGRPLSLDCSGTDYVITLDKDLNEYSLSLFAECSNACNADDTFYYYDVSGLNVLEIRAIRTINGSSGLDMPSTLESNCTVFGCYDTLDGQKNFIPASCSLARLPAEALSSEAFLSSEVPPTAQTTIIVDSNNFPSTTPVSSTTQTPKPSAGSKTSPPSSTSKITQASSKTTLPSKYSVDSALMRVGTPTSVVVLILVIIAAVLLLLGLCRHYHKNKSNIIQLHYSEKMFDSSNSNDEFKVYEDGDKLFHLAPATSQVSVFNSFYKCTVDAKKPILQKTNLEHSYSLSSDYFEVEEGDSHHFAEMGMMKKRDLSDSSSAGGVSDLTEDMTQEEEDVVESASENEDSNCNAQGLDNSFATQSPQTSLCSTPVGSGSMSNQSQANTCTLALRNAEQQLPSDYIRSSSLGAEAFETASPVRLQPVIGSNYVTNIGNEMHTTNELQSATETPSHVPEAVSFFRKQSSAGSDYLPSDRSGIRTESLLPAVGPDRALDIALPNEFIDIGLSDDSLATPQPVCPVKMTEFVSESCSNIGSEYIPNSSHESVWRTDFNQQCTSDYVQNTSVSPAKGYQSLQPDYLPNRSQSSQDGSGNASVFGSVSLSSHKNSPSLQPYPVLDENNDPESIVRITPSPLHVVANRNGSAYVPSCSESTWISRNCRPSTKLQAPKHPQSYSTSTNCKEDEYLSEPKHTAASSGYIFSSKESFPESFPAAGECEDEDTESDATFIEEYSSLDEEEEDRESSTPNYDENNASPLPFLCKNKIGQESLQNSLQTFDHVSIALEPVDHFSEGTEDLETFAEEYLNSDNDEARDEEQPFILKRCRESYICGDLTIGTGSIQFDFPYKKAGLVRTRKLDQSFGLDWNKDRNSPDHTSQHNAADVSDLQFSFNHSSSSVTTSTAFQENTSGFFPSKTVNSTLFQNSTRTINTSPHANLNTINYSFDGED